MRVAVFTREFPPHVYGGAGVHVEHLVAALGAVGGGSLDVRVETFAEHGTWERLEDGALRAIATDLSMVEAAGGVDIVHSHTWYANLAGHLAKLRYGIPHVATTHSLEPMRPWKAEQLGGGYHLSGFCERTGLEGADAIIAVSAGMRADVLRCYPAVDAARVHVVHNGIDAEAYAPDRGTDHLAALGIAADRPTVVFIGRITHQKGLVHLLEAAPQLRPDAQLVLLAGQPDTDVIAADVRRRVAALEREVVWIEQMLPRPTVVQILSHATVLVCPSVYEPFGLVNLEAMACATAVVASDVGGIPEIVVHGETGLLVPPGDADALAAACNELLGDPERAATMGRAGRERVLQHFTWNVVARRTVDVYARCAEVNPRVGS